MIEPTEDSEICLSVIAKPVSPVMDVSRFSSFKRVRSYES